jgi:IMP dehydrogenase
MRFLAGNRPSTDLTYADVFMVPNRSAVGSRLEVDLTTPDAVGTTIPVVVANMTAISGRRMAETVARRGGVAVLPQDIPVDVVGEVVAWLKARHPVYDTAITLKAHSTVGEALALMSKRAHGVVVVVKSGRPVGIVTDGACQGVDRFTQLSQVMTEPLTIPAGTDLPKIFDVLSEERVNAAPVVDGDQLVGIVTRKGALRSAIYRPALDGNGTLLTSAAVGINGDVAGKAAALLEHGVDVLVVDTAHGHQEKAVEAVRAARSVAGSVPVVAGNVVTADGTNDLIEAGADVVKVGVGPGAMCTTRMMTGVGRPQFSAVEECAAAARVGRRRRAAPAGRRPRPGRRRGQRDGRLVVRRHLRERRRHPRRRLRPVVQGVVRHGLGPRGQGPDGDGVGLRAGPRRPVRGGHQLLADVPGPRTAGRRGPDRPDRGRRPLVVHLRRGAHGRRAVREGGARRAERGRLRGGPAAADVVVKALPAAEFEELVADALDAVPPELMALLDNVVVLVEDRNPDEPDLLGLYEGYALTERGWDYGGALPDRIMIYREAICDICSTPEDVVDEVTITVVHEIAHHFGIDEDRLHDLGWG